MEAYAYILYRLVLFWGKVPPEVVAAGLFAVPGLVGFLAGLPYVPGLVVGGLVTWWFVGIFTEHVWPDIPPEHRHILVAIRDLALFKKPVGELRRLRGMRVTILPHAASRMEEFGISVADVYRVLSEPEEDGKANLGRLYAQRTIGLRRIRVVYNLGAEDERIVVSAMLRRR